MSKANNIASTYLAFSLQISTPSVVGPSRAKIGPLQSWHLVQVVYNDTASGPAHKASSGQCCFDPHRGHLCVALKPQGGPFACFGGSKHQSPRDKNAERYSLLRKLTITEPSPNVLELNFTVADKEGAPRIAEQQNLGSGKARQRRLERIAISPCSATEIKVITVQAEQVACFPAAVA